MIINSLKPHTGALNHLNSLIIDLLLTFQMDSDSGSSVQTRVLKRCRRRILYSSDEDSHSSRQDECPDIHCEPAPKKRSSSPPCGEQSVLPSKNKHRENTAGKSGSSSPSHGRKPSSSTGQCSTSSHKPVVIESEIAGTSYAEEEVVITLSHDDESPWQTEDDTDSDTSTPSYKRGRRGKQPNYDQLAVEEIQLHGVKLPRAPRWMRNRKNKPPTTLILADSFFQNWPESDARCVVMCQTDYDIWRWNAMIRSRELNVQFYNIVLCIRKLQELRELPLQNTLQALCRSIRAANPECRIFVSNMPPNPNSTPVLGRRISVFNLELQQAVEGIRQRLMKVHFLAIYEHFTDSSSGRTISPVKSYFRSEQEFTKLGCAMFREFLLREAGLKSYWF